jgi:hypothetical protein
MSTCCQQLKSKVLSKVGTCDLNQISLQLSRLDGIHWVDMSQNDELFSKIAHLNTPVVRTDAMSGEDFKEQQLARREQFTQAANSMIMKPYSFHARLQVEFELMPTAV